MKLTNTTIKNAKPKDKSYKLSDGGGLYLWVTKAGNKVWRMKYRFPKGGKEKTLVFGDYIVVSLMEAREKQMEAKKLKKDLKNLIPIKPKK